MDIRCKKYSYSVSKKIVAFMIVILCFSSAVTLFLNIAKSQQGDLGIVFEDSYYLSEKYMEDNQKIIDSLTTLIKYKDEEHIVKGETVTLAEVKREEDNLYSQFKYSKNYNHKLSDEENYNNFLEIYADKIARIKDELIQEDLKDYKLALHRLKDYQGLFYYASDGEKVFTNSPNTDKEYFKNYPSYLIVDEYEKTEYPEEVTKNPYYYRIKLNINNLKDHNNAMYLAFTKEFLTPRIEEWQQNKKMVTTELYKIIGLLLGFVLALIYLVIVIGRKSPEDREIHLNFVDKIYNDLNLLMCFFLIGTWIGLIGHIFYKNYYKIIFPVTLLIGTIGLILVLALIKHIKNKTIIRHTLIYIISKKLFKFFKQIYESGNLGVKALLLIIGYPILALYMFPIAVGLAVWLTFKKVKEFNIIKEGLKKVQEGDLHYKINLSGKGELARLAEDINSLTDGLKKAVENELKSERLKTELITNVSHDIRTPLTSIITYVDLLKKEKDQTKKEEYIKIIDQKSQRLKVLTDDLFEASKASSGNIPVNYEKIDIASLITQGLGELDDKIQERKLEFKVNYPKNKVYVKADGKLLWRVIENLLSNVFKYSLEGSRVYLDVFDLGTEVKLEIKNISAYELNISAEELMERFKRGDESRTSQGSGLGLSIAKSLIEIQKGTFNIEIDGDLFKAIIKMPKHEN